MTHPRPDHLDHVHCRVGSSESARVGLDGFTFHDSRHTAATRLAPLVDVLTLCKIFGWAKADQALVYYNPTGSQIAARLSAAVAPTPPAR